MQEYYRLNTTVLSDTYKYLNYMFRPLRNIVGLDTAPEEKKLYNIIWYSTNVGVV